VKNIGKPCAVALHARFDEGGLVRSTKEWLLRHRQTKGAETDRRIPNDDWASSLLYPELAELVNPHGKDGLFFLYPFMIVRFKE
jgi:hypothetical protein